MLSRAAWKECLAIGLVGLCVGIAMVIFGYWPLAVVAVITTLGLLAFFRDPERRTPAHRGVVVAPSDGTVSSIHDLDRFEPFDGPAVCIRIFMSVFDVHINRCPCHGKVASITHKPGQHRNTLNPESAEDNESTTTLFVHAVKEHPVAAVRQIAGLLARTITNTLNDRQVVQRGSRMGLIKLGSTTELYLPATLNPEVKVRQGQKVLGGMTVLAGVTPLDASKPEHPVLAAINQRASGTPADQNAPTQATNPTAAATDPPSTEA